MFDRKKALYWGAILLIIGFFLPWAEIDKVGVVNGFDMFRYSDEYAKKIPNKLKEKTFKQVIKDTKKNTISSIPKEKFDNWILYNIENDQDKDFLKKQYQLNKNKKVYELRIDITDEEKNKLNTVLKKANFQDRAFLKHAYNKLYILDEKVTMEQKQKIFNVLKQNHFMNIAPVKIPKKDFENQILAKIKRDNITSISKMKYEIWIMNNIRKEEDKELIRNNYTLNEATGQYKLNLEIESGKKQKIIKILKGINFQDKKFVKKSYYFDNDLNAYRLRGTLDFTGKCRLCEIFINIKYIDVIPNRIPAQIFNEKVLNNEQITSHKNFSVIKKEYNFSGKIYYLNSNLTGNETRRLRSVLRSAGYTNIPGILEFIWSFLPWVMLICGIVSIALGAKKDKRALAMLFNYGSFASIILFVLFTGFSVLGTGVLISILGGIYLPLTELLLVTGVVKHKKKIKTKDELQDYLRDNTGQLVKKKKTIQHIAFTGLVVILLAVAAIVFFIFLYLIVNGAKYIDAEMLFGTGERGVMKAIIGTFLVTIITALLSIPIGVSTAIYLNEYARQNKLNRMIRLAIRTLSGVPSVVYGLFGLIIFIRVASIPTSIIAAGLTLGLMTIPWVISSSEEALRSIPMGYREGSLALGASKWYTIRKNVLPYAISGIITGGIIGLARAAGETAPILFTGAASIAPLRGFPQIFLADFEALSYKIYYFSSVDPNMFKLRGVVYATCLILILLVLVLMITAIIIRYRLRKKYQVL